MSKTTKPTSSNEVVQRELRVMYYAAKRIVEAAELQRDAKGNAPAWLVDALNLADFTVQQEDTNQVDFYLRSDRLGDRFVYGDTVTWREYDEFIIPQDELDLYFSAKPADLQLTDLVNDVKSAVVDAVTAVLRDIVEADGYQPSDVEDDYTRIGRRAAGLLRVLDNLSTNDKRLDAIQKDELTDLRVVLRELSGGEA